MVTTSTVEQVTAKLRDDIRAGRLAAGQRLVEAEITESLQISRGPLREAFRRLAAEGLIELQHHRGARVRRLSREEVIATFQVREVLEGLAARLAADAVRERHADASLLQSLVNDMDSALAEGQISAYRKLNQQFHDQLMELAGNPRLAEIARQLSVAVGRIQSQTALDLRLQHQGQAHHIRIAQAVAQGDGDGADEVMREHIRASRTLAEAAMEQPATD